MVSEGADDPQLTAPKELRMPCYCRMDLTPATRGRSLEVGALLELPKRNATLETQRREASQAHGTSGRFLWDHSLTQQQETTA